jgi:hypothetical protein
MIAAAAIGIFMIPPLYVFFQWLREKIKRVGTKTPRGAAHGVPAAAE